MSYPLQAPVPAPMPEKKARNIVGLIALVMSVIGFVFACIPGALIIGWILLPVSFILGLVGLFRRGESHWPAITAVIVAVVGTIVGVIVFLGVVSDAVDDAFSSAGASVGSAAADSSSQGASASKSGTRDNPLPLGTEISGQDWKVVVNSVTFDANDAVRSANEFNEAPEEGHEYVLINYSVTYTGDDSNGQTPAFVSVDYVSPDGVTIDRSDSLAVAPDAIDTLTTLYNGGSVTGNTVLSIPSATAQDGVLAVQPGLLDDKVFVAVK